MFPHIPLQSSQNLSGLQAEASDFLGRVSENKKLRSPMSLHAGDISVYTYGIGHFYISHVYF